MERRVRLRSGNPTPRYPLGLERQGVDGTVRLQFVVDAQGRAVSSVKVLQPAHDLFTQALRDVLLRFRFEPATIGGWPMRQLVQMPFRFRQP